MRTTPTSAFGGRARTVRACGRSRCRAGRRSATRRSRDQLAEAVERLRGRSPPRPSQSSAPAMNASASRAGAGWARPSRGTCRRSRCSSSSAIANEQTAITIALRVPIFANCSPPCGRADVERGDQLVRLEHVALRAGDELRDRDAALAARRRDLDLGVRRVQRRQRVTGGGGGAEVAADRAAVADLRRADRPRRDAPGPGSPSPSSSIARVYVTPAPIRSVPSSRSQRVSSRTRVRSSIASGRARPKFISTITSVPPHTGNASGWAALASSASAQLAGCRNSIRAGYCRQQAAAGSCPASRTACSDAARPSTRVQTTANRCSTVPPHGLRSRATST